MPPELIKNAEPWYASMMVQILAYQKLGMSADGGVDVTLMARAEQAHQKIVPLEGFEEQIGFFDAMPEPLQIALLKATLDEVDGSAVVLDKMVKAWSKGDVGALAKLINEDLEQFAELRAILLDQRNAHWADWIAKRLDTPGTVFLAVGAGHLGGKNNVRALLEAKGFKVERVQ